MHLRRGEERGCVEEGCGARLLPLVAQPVGHPPSAARAPACPHAQARLHAPRPGLQPSKPHFPHSQAPLAIPPRRHASLLHCKNASAHHPGVPAHRATAQRAAARPAGTARRPGTGPTAGRRARTTPRPPRGSWAWCGTFRSSWRRRGRGPRSGRPCWMRCGHGPRAATVGGGGARGWGRVGPSVHATELRVRARACVCVCVCVLVRLPRPPLAHRPPPSTPGAGQ